MDLREGIGELARRLARLGPVMAGDGALVAAAWTDYYPHAVVLRGGPLPIWLYDGEGGLAGVLGHGWFAATDEALAVRGAQPGVVHVAGDLPPGEAPFLASFLASVAARRVATPSRHAERIARAVGPADVRFEHLPSATSVMMRRIAEAALRDPGGLARSSRDTVTTDPRTVAENLRAVLEWGLPPPTKGLTVVSSIGEAVFDPEGWRPPAGRRTANAREVVDLVRRRVPQVAITRDRVRDGNRKWLVYGLDRFPGLGGHSDAYVAFPADPDDHGPFDGRVPLGLRGLLQDPHLDVAFVHGTSAPAWLAERTLPFLYGRLVECLEQFERPEQEGIHLCIFALSAVYDLVRHGDGSVGIRAEMLPARIDYQLSPKTW